eukprot:CAMPEP_0117580110 /NCGR_PEP_ID=MMETSP0784-20121206/65005_1 /TAXON_ID=39447 /ORGANISM="" /LENGTH=52 /DNA_ID=CAMNT_0005380105 /DNA_START=273 /DNA_END=431 /DNA_ORIENTATION=+
MAIADELTFVYTILHKADFELELSAANTMSIASTRHTTNASNVNLFLASVAS